MFSCKEEAEYYYSQMGAAEAEMQAENDYAEYLHKLIEDGDYELYSFHKAIDLINSKEFKKSGLSANDFLVKKMNELTESRKPKDKKEVIENKKDEEENKNDDDLPF